MTTRIMPNGSGMAASRSGARPHAGARKIAKYVVFYTCLALIGVIFVAPYVLAFFGALKPPADLYSSSPWTPPHSFYTGNFRTILFSVYLATLMVPNVVTMVPLYTMMRQFHLTNTYWAIFLPYVLGVPYTIFLMRQYFMSLPSEVFAAARVDGCSEWRLLTRILIPMGRPIIITATLIAFVFGWNNFLWPLIVTDAASRQVLTVSIAALQSAFSEQWNLVLAASLVALVPLLVIFVVFQKHIVKSIQLSGVNR